MFICGESGEVLLLSEELGMEYTDNARIRVKPRIEASERSRVMSEARRLC
jgi:hypothetical protein